MKKHRVDYSIDEICACFGVSRSGYYAWLHRKPSQRHQNRQHLDNRVRLHSANGYRSPVNFEADFKQSLAF